MRVAFQVAFFAVLITCGGFAGTAVGSDFSEFLHAVFDDHHSRPPSGVELNYYSNVYRTEGPMEAYMRMVSSRDYYVTQCQRNAEVYVTRLYQIFLHRTPQQHELRFWVNQLLETNASDRYSFVRRFCEANNLHQVPSAPPYTPVSTTTFRVPNTVPATTAALVAKVDLFRQLVQRDIGGSRRGQMLLDESATLLSTAIQYRDTANSRQTTDQQRKIAYQNLETELQRVERRFNEVPVSTTQVRNTLWEISQLVSACRPKSTLVPLPSSPPGPIEVSAGRLSSLLRPYVSQLAAYENDSPFYAKLSRDVSGLWVQVESLRRLAQTTSRRSDLQRSVRGITQQGREISRQVNLADSRFSQGWWNIQHELNKLAKAAGFSGDLYVTSTHPVVINRPAWNHFPSAISPGGRTSSVNRQVVDLSDQLVTEIDKYINSLRSIANRNATASRMINQSLDLRHDVLILRQKASAGDFGTQLRYVARDVNRQYRDVASQTFMELVSQDATMNSPIWMQIGRLSYEIEKLVGA